METILFIEDDPALRENLGKILSLNNYYPLLAETGTIGLQVAKKMLPDLIICDIMLPDTDGYQILSELSNNKETSTIPFIFLTAKAEMSDLRKGMNLGADDYLTKPLKTKEILKAIRLRLDKKKKITSIVPQGDPKGKDQQEKNILSIEEPILVSSDGKVQSVNLSEIVCIVSAGVYSYIHILSGKKYLIRKIIKEWEGVLPEKYFIRIHQSSIVNITHIKSIEKCPNRTFRIFMPTLDRPLFSSHKYSKKISKKLYR